MPSAAACRSIQGSAALLIFGNRRHVARDEIVKWRVARPKFERDERRQSLADMRDGDIGGTVDIVKGLDKHIPIFRNHADTLCKNRPDCVNPIVKRPCHFVFLRVAGHFELRRHRKYGLRTKHRL